MPDEGNIRGTMATSRRHVIKKSVEVAVTAPAVALLLNASTKPAFAQIVTPSCACEFRILDDFSFGNNREDIDAHAEGSNFNPLNQSPQQDDHV